MCRLNVISYAIYSLFVLHSPVLYFKDSLITETLFRDEEETRLITYNYVINLPLNLIWRDVTVT